MKNQSKLVRAFYIVLVPVVLVVILLNSGVLQKWLTAVTVDGEPYSAVRYDYYYYSVYLDFLDSDYEAAGFDPAVSAGSQIYDGDETWREHFCQQAEERLALTAYYNGQAQAAGYTFSQEELAPVEEKLQQIKEESARLGILEGNYYPAYYGTGMDRDAFVRELTLEVQAQAYRQHLSEELQVSGQEIEQWLEKNPVQDYPMADLWLVELDAVPARSDGAVGQRQLDDLEARLGRLEARMEQGREGIEELCLKFSDVVWGDNGLVTGAVKEDLPETVARWCFAEGRTGGASASLMDREAGKAYLVVLTGLSGSAAEQAARQSIREQRMEALEAQALKQTRVERSTLGMQLAAS